MKTYSIGRDIGCNIVINDNTDIISRRHAIINVSSTGKITIIDQSNNGTYVNGIRISSNVPVPITRKDSISFAHIVKLDWSLIPKSTMWIKYLLGAAGALILLVAIYFLATYYLDYKKKIDNPTPIEIPTKLDSTEISQSNANKQDSSTLKQPGLPIDSTNTPEVKKEPKEKTKKTDNQKPKPEESVKDSTQVIRPIG